jgi:hypothetical protein
MRIAGVVSSAEFHGVDAVALELLQNVLEGQLGQQGGENTDSHAASPYVDKILDQNITMKRILILALLALPAWPAEDWGPVNFLIGNWKGEGTGSPGQGSGGFSFAPDLMETVLVRKNYAEYPPANGKPGFRHEDLMVVYRDETTKQLRATYFDSEGHVIQYGVKPANQGVVFVSEGPSSATRYRLTYTKDGADRLKLKFDIAPPGKDFATYIEASAKRE